MKKIRVILLTILCVFCGLFFSCQKHSDLSKYIVNLQSDIFYGENGDIKLKGGYSYCLEQGEKVYFLTFKLLEKEMDNASYSISFMLDKEYSSTFSLSPVTNSLTTKVEVVPFSQKEFTVNVFVGSERYDINMLSLLPSSVVSPVDGVNSLLDSQPELINLYKNENGGYDLSIEVRIIVKNEKAFYYVGLIDKNKQLKALLIDGQTKEVLAIRNIFS